VEALTQRSRTSVLGAALISALVAGPLGGLIVAVGVMGGYPAGDLAETPGAMLLVWGVLMGFFIACVPAAIFGATVGRYVRKHASLHSRGMRLRAILTSAVLGAAFGAISTTLVGGPGTPVSLFAFAGAMSGAACGLAITRIVDSDRRADAAAAQLTAGLPRP
jgi:hypothetical protein